jgi:predicted anti-sigma-YlaC factor YlaD
MDDCHAVREFIYSYLDGELDGPANCRVHTHLLGCLSCQGLVEAERAFLHLFRMNTETPPAPLIASQIVESLARRPTDPDPHTTDQPQ